MRTLHVILNGCTGQQKSIPAVEAEKCFPAVTGRVLDVLSFVKDHILPFDSLKVLLILSYLANHIRKRWLVGTGDVPSGNL